MRYFESLFFLTLEYELSLYNYVWQIYKSIEYLTYLKLSWFGGFFIPSSQVNNFFPQVFLCTAFYYSGKIDIPEINMDKFGNLLNLKKILFFTDCFCVSLILYHGEK